MMTSWGKALSFGFLVWLIPFLVALIAFPVKESWRSLFESIMPVTLSITVVVFTGFYLRRVSKAFLQEGVRVGLLWLAICTAIDLPLMLNPPISYTLTEYIADIGLTYLMIPVITVGMALAASRHADEMKS